MLRTNSLRRGAALAMLVLFALAAGSLAASSEQQQQQGLSMAAAKFDADDATWNVSAITDRRFTPLLPTEPEAAAPSKKMKKPAHFTISDDAFHLDGELFTLLSGEIHQFRIPKEYWRDRLRRVRALGFNSVTVYVPWNFHQPESPDSFDFTGDRDLTRFLDLAVEEDLFVVLRPPPYVCAEWDFGGLPAWLADPGAVAGGGVMPLRSSQNPEWFLAAVDRWYGALLPRLRPYLIENGGPILMVQVENEYGNGGEPDVPYLKAVASLVRKHLDSEEVLLFTTDAPRFVSNGSVPFSSSSSDKGGSSSDPNFVAMIDSGAGWNASDLDATFAPLREINGGASSGRTPFFSSELYDGWVQFAGASFAVTNVSVARVAARMDGLLGKSKARGGGGGGLSLYMAAGGSNFGFSAGGATNTDDDSFSAIIQSYDYAAPVSEGGSTDRQPGYGGPPRATAVRAVLQKYRGAASSAASEEAAAAAAAKSPSYLSSGALAPVPPMPADPPVASYGRAELSQRATLLSALPQLSSSSPRGTPAAAPLPMELFGQNRGFIVYSTRVPRSLLSKPGGGALFEVGGGGAVHDLGTVLVDGVSQGTLDRGRGAGDGGSRLRLREAVAGSGGGGGGNGSSGNSSSSSSSSSSSFAELSVVVGMTGRSNAGGFDTKGLNGSVLIDGRELEGEGGWTVWLLPFDDARKVESVDLAAAAASAAASSSSSSSSSSPLLTVEESGPLLLRGSFEVSAEQAEASTVGEEWEGAEEDGEEDDDGKLGRKRKRRRRAHPADTYLSFEGLSRGVAFVNGIALGWYDLVEGPQMRIFVPGVWLREGRNDVLVLEMVGASAAGAAVESVLEPDFFGPPKKKEEEKKKTLEEGSSSSFSSSPELETSSMLRFPGAGTLRRTESATTTTS